MAKTKRLPPYEEISPGLRSRRINDALILRVDLASLERSQGDLSFMLQTKPNGVDLADYNVRLSMVHPLSYYHLIVKRQEHETKQATKLSDKIKAFRAKFFRPKKKAG